jgi:chaperonin GroES
MTFRPWHDRVVLGRIEPENKTADGILIPDTAKQKVQEGEVLAVGPGARDAHGRVQPLDLQAGDRVLFGKWSGSEVNIERVEYLILNEADILDVLDDSAAVKAA